MLAGEQSRSEDPDCSGVACLFLVIILGLLLFALSGRNIEIFNYECFHCYCVLIETILTGKSGSRLFC